MIILPTFREVERQWRVYIVSVVRTELPIDTIKVEESGFGNGILERVQVEVILN